MRRAIFSAALCAIPKASFTNRSLPLAGPAAVMAPLLVATQHRFASDAEVAKITRRELEDEQQRSDKPLKPEVPSGWTVDRKPGDTFFEMRRNYEDEEILLRFAGESHENDAVSYKFTVYVTRNANTMAFSMSFEDGEVLLERVLYFSDAKKATDLSPEGKLQRDNMYGGPDLEGLDEGLLDSFVSYLEKRGVNDALGEFLEKYASWSEQAEYVEWLCAINRFVS